MKNEGEIYVVDCESEVQAIKKLDLQGNKWSSKIVYWKRGKKRSHAAIASCESKQLISKFTPLSF